MKKWILLIMLVLMINIAYAATCTDIVTPNTNCTMLTPSINCISYTYEVFNESGALADSGSLTQLNDTIYYFIFNETGGDYIVKLCDDSTKEITAGTSEVGSMSWSIALMLGFLCFTILMFVLAFKIDEEHSPLKVLYYFLGLISIASTLHLTSKIVQAMDPTQLDIINFVDHIYGIWIYIMGFIMVYYFIIYFIFGTVLKKMADNKKKKDEEFET